MTPLHPIADSACCAYYNGMSLSYVWASDTISPSALKFHTTTFYSDNISSSAKAAGATDIYFMTKTITPNS